MCRPMPGDRARRSFLPVAAVFQIVDGAQVVGAGMLRGLHDTRVPMLFALVGYWVVGLGIGVWLAFAAAGRASASGSASPSAWARSRC